MKDHDLAGGGGPILKPTQTSRIRSYLEGNAGLCAMVPIDWHPPIIRVAARINDLRNMGYVITTIPCRQHGLGSRANHAYYRLKFKDGPV